jgi:glycosyltransferase involved in cell wall biosynthesis
MSPRLLMRPRRVLITLDAVGGVWRYALDLASALARQGIHPLLVGSGPRPDAGRRSECARIGAELTWIEAPLDWLAADGSEMAKASGAISGVAAEWQADLLHLNLPSQAADLPIDLPIVVASHSCVATWWEAVRGGELPEAWRWQYDLNHAGLGRADVVLVPSRSHGMALERVYGPIRRLQVVHNAASLPDTVGAKTDIFLSAGRWWDEGKNGRTLDRAAASSPWPVVMAGPLAGPNGERMPVQHARAPGELSAGAMLELMHQAAVFVAPSRYEPFGLAVLEAAASGAALLLADIPTFRELWDGAARFVPADEPDAYVQAMEELARDPASRRNLAEKARFRARQFTPQRQVDGVLQAYGAAMLRHVPADMDGDRR